MERTTIIEKELAKAIEDKLIELIWHPELRKNYSISIMDRDESASFYCNEDNPPMSVLEEYVFLSLYLTSSNLFNNWMENAVKAVQCLRRMPDPIRVCYLSWYHKQVAQWYKEGKKAERHWLQAAYYGVMSGTIYSDIFDEWAKGSPDRYIAACLEACSYLLQLTFYGGDNFFPWNKEQYEWIEQLLIKTKTYVTQYQQDDLLQTCIYFFDAVYHKKTRRYNSAAVSFEQAIVHLQQTNELEKRFQKKVVRELLQLKTAAEEMSNFPNLGKPAFLCLIANVKESYLLPREMKSYIACLLQPYETEITEEEEEVDEESIEKRDYTFDEVYQLAEVGDAEAQRCIGFSYLRGDGVTANFRVGMEWLKIAALNGETSAQFHLANCYQYGDGVEQDIEAALDLYEKAAEQKYAYADFFLALLYLTGEGSETDLVKADKLFRKVLIDVEEDELEKILDILVEYEKENPEFASQCQFYERLYQEQLEIRQ